MQKIIIIDCKDIIFSRETYHVYTFNIAASSFKAMC